MFPVGYMSCAEIKWKCVEDCIVYFHVFENSKDIVTVCMTDSTEFLLSTLEFDNIRKAYKKIHIVEDSKISSSFMQSLRNEIHYDEFASTIKVPISNGNKSSEVVINFSTVDTPDERSKYMKTMLFSLARIAQKSNKLQQQQMVPQTPPARQNIPRGPPRTPQKRDSSAMSIINPGSKRIHRTPGIKYEEEDSDSS